jgi:hypothetical protein
MKHKVGLLNLAEGKKGAKKTMPGIQNSNLKRGIEGRRLECFSVGYP